MIKKKSFTFGLLLALAMVCLSVPALAQDNLCFNKLHYAKIK
jgi:hypothetical protein